MVCRKGGSHFYSHFISRSLSQAPPTFKRPRMCLKGEEEVIFMTILSDDIELSVAFWMRHRFLCRAVPFGWSFLPEKVLHAYLANSYFFIWGGGPVFTGKPSWTTPPHHLPTDTSCKVGHSMYSVGLIWLWEHLIWFLSDKSSHLLPWQGRRSVGQPPSQHISYCLPQEKHLVNANH